MTFVIIEHLFTSLLAVHFYSVLNFLFMASIHFSVHALAPPLQKITFHDLQWMPVTADSTQPCIYYVFSTRTYLFT